MSDASFTLTCDNEGYTLSAGSGKLECDSDRSGGAGGGDWSNAASFTCTGK